MDDYRIKWSSSSIYVNIDTGEVLKKSTVLLTDKYIIIQTTKTIEHYGQTKGHIRYTIKCKQNPQRNIFEDYSE